jgi:hypothetical protein
MRLSPIGLLLNLLLSTQCVAAGGENPATEQIASVEVVEMALRITLKWPIFAGRGASRGYAFPFATRSTGAAAGPHFLHHG